jgi:hypothetical protein
MYSDIDFEEEIVLSLGDEALSKKFNIQVYPNPLNKFLTITLNNSHLASNISIYDLNGKRLYEETIEGMEVTLDITKVLKSGIYLLKVADSRQSTIKKIIVQSDQ